MNAIANFFKLKLGHANVGKSLIENNADLNVKDMYGYTPLLWTALKGMKKQEALIGSYRVVEEKNQLRPETQKR